MRVQLMRVPCCLAACNHSHKIMASGVEAVDGDCGWNTGARADQHRQSCTACDTHSLALSQEVALIGLLSYLSYLAAEVLGLSGILSLFCCGLTVSQFALDNM